MVKQVFVVYSIQDGSKVFHDLKLALRSKSRRLRLPDITQAMRAGNPAGNAQLRQIVQTSDSVVLLFTPSALPPSVHSRIFEKVMDEAIQAGKTIFPVEIDGTQSSQYDKHGPPVQIKSGNAADIDWLSNEILKDGIDGSFIWWRDLPRRVKAIIGTAVVVLGLIFAFLALVPEKDRAIFWCRYFPNFLPSCQPTSTPTPIAIVPSDTPVPPTPTFIPTEQEASAPVSTPVLGALLFNEKFESGTFPSNWVVDNGQWRIVADGSNNAYQSVNNIYSELSSVSFGNPEWTNYELEFRIKTNNLASARQAYVSVRNTSYGNTKVAVTFDFATDKILLYQLVQSSGNAQQLDSTIYRFQDNEWLTVRIDVKFNTVKLFLNNELDPRLSGVIDPTIQTGLVNLKSNSSSIVFDDLRVWSLLP